MDTTLRTLLISPFFDAALPSGGVLHSIDVTREWLRRGRGVSVLCSSATRSLGDLQVDAEQGHLQICDDIPLEAIRFTHRLSPKLYTRTRALIDQYRTQVVHVHNIHGCISAIEAVLDAGLPIMITALDFGLLCFNFHLYDGSLSPCAGPESPAKCARCVMRGTRGPGAWLGPRLPRSWSRRLWPRFARLDQAQSAVELHGRMKAALLGATAIVAPSPVVAERLAAFGAPRERIHPIVYGVCPEKIVRPAKEPSAELRLAFLGGAEPVKGLGLLAATAALLPDGLPLRITSYGGDQVHAAVSAAPARAQRYLVARPARFGRELAEEHARIDAVVVPSLWHENSPFVVLESLANGTPVIASDQAGIAHLIAPGRNGWLLEPGNPTAWSQAILLASQQPELLRGMQAEARFSRTTVDFVNDLENAEKQSIQPGRASVRANDTR